VLLKPVNKNLALMNLLFNMIQTAVLVVNKLNLLIPLFLLGDAAYLKAVDLPVLQSLSYMFIGLHRMLPGGSNGGLRLQLTEI
jgi:Domain of unknown function (DUF4386)